MKIANIRTVVGFVVLGVCSCKKPDDIEDIIEDIAETGGDDGLYMPDVDLPGEGEDPVLLPSGECVQIPQSGAYGYVHQCEGSIQIEVDAPDEHLEASFTFGPGATNPQYWLDPDSYELPLVAACCGPYDYVMPTTEQKKPYINNCLLDSAQQICEALPHFLRRQAAVTENAIEKLAINNLADLVEEEKAACLLNLWGSGPTVDAPSRLLNTKWSPKNNVTITLVESEVVDWTVEGDVSWDRCQSFFDNDSAVIPTAPFTVPGIVGMGQANLLSGTTMTGSGPVGANGIIIPSTGDSWLTLAYLVDGSVRVVGLQINAGPSTVTIDNVSFVLERSSLLLADVMEPRYSGGEYVVGAGDARFVATTIFDGDSRIIGFTNDDPIVFRQTSTGTWEFDPFDLIYDETGVGVWTLSFDGLAFSPST